MLTSRDLLERLAGKFDHWPDGRTTPEHDGKGVVQ